MIVFIGADHKGFPMKAGLIAWLISQGHDVRDVGSIEVTEGDDYPDYAELVAKAITKSPEEYRGILICGSGVGMAVAANKVPGIRAAMIHDVDIAKAARNDDNINVLALGAEFISLEEAEAVTATFLATPFSGAERHVQRIEKITTMEQ